MPKKSIQQPKNPPKQLLKHSTKPVIVKYTVPLKILKPLLRTLPAGFKISAFREVNNGKELIRYDVHRISSGENIAYAEVKRERGKLYLDGIYVLPEYRNMGLASYLIDTVIVNHTYADVYLLARPYKDKLVSKEELIHFYGRRGFVPVDQRGTMVYKAKPHMELDSKKHKMNK